MTLRSDTAAVGWAFRVSFLHFLTPNATTLPVTMSAPMNDHLRSAHSSHSHKVRRVKGHSVGDERSGRRSSADPLIATPSTDSCQMNENTICSHRSSVQCRQ